MVKPTTENLIRLILTALLLICVIQLPFGYYHLIRFVVVVGFAFLADYEYKRKNISVANVYVGLMVIYKPIGKIPLGR